MTELPIPNIHAGPPLKFLPPQGADTSTGQDALRFSPDGKYLVVTRQDECSSDLLTNYGGGTDLFDVHTGRLVKTFPHKTHVDSSACSPDSKWLFNCDHPQGCMRMFDVEEEECVHEVYTSRYLCGLAASAEFVATGGGDQKILVYKYSREECSKVAELTDCDDCITVIKFSPS
eukprot:gene20832-7717_t